MVSELHTKVTKMYMLCDLIMFINRYEALTNAMEESTSTRIFVENMMKKAGNDPECSALASERPMKAFTQMVQETIKTVDGLRNGAREIMPKTPAYPKGRAKPWLGPAALREAYLRLKVFAASFAIS